MIKILNLKLKNFKGIRELEVKFGDLTTISGENATGKSTVFDAFTWLLFGKNSQDAKDFEVKTLDQFNQPIHRLEHTVIGLLDIDGRHIKLSRTYREKWTKRRGSEEQEFTGHETIFEVDDVPTTQKDYNEKVADILPEATFKLLTNPYYFNTIAWKERRAMLFEIAGEVKDSEIASGNAAYLELLTTIDMKKISMDEYKIQCASQRKKLNDRLSEIPIRINELTGQVPKAPDASQINKEIENLKVEQLQIEQQISGTIDYFNQLNAKAQEAQQQKHEFSMKIADLENKIKAEYNAKFSSATNERNQLSMQVDSYKRKIATIEQSMKYTEATIQNLTHKIEETRKKWTEKNTEQIIIKEDNLLCPACKRPLENIAEKKGQMLSGFNEAKMKALDEISAGGKNLKAELEGQKVELEAKQTELKNYNEGLKQVEARIAELQEPDVQSVESIIAADLDIRSLKKQRDEIEVSEIQTPDVSELKDKKAGITAKIIELEKSLYVQDEIARIETRIDELKAEEKNLSKEIAAIERIIFTVDEFTREKIEATEELIAGKFEGVRFKMFNKLINGGYEPTCETLVNGVPFSDANHAAQINTGIKIINAFNMHFNTTAPIFVDNAEAVVKLADTDSQVIKLVVTTENELTIKS